MFHSLGKFVARFWKALIPLWVCCVVLFALSAPQFESVLRDGEFAFLPADSPSLVGERLLSEAFPQIKSASQVVIVANRETNGKTLLPEDKQFLTEKLIPRLEQLTEEGNESAESTDTAIEEPVSEGSIEAGSLIEADANSLESGKNEVTGSPSVITKIRSFDDRYIGKLLLSEDQKATLVIVEFSTEFLDKRSHPAILKIEQIVDELQGEVPTGLNLAISGSSTVGRDIIQAAQDSANATELWTILLVIILLILIYRAPFLAIVPLITVFLATKMALSFLAILAGWNLIGLFNGIEIYVTVVLYGAGVDYCMFLISRFREELDAGNSLEESIEKSIGNVGSAIAASAGTTICGLAMMAFAEFGKFHQAGIAMSVSLLFVLFASLTFAPALLLLAGRWAFWPQVYSERITASSGWVSPTSLVARIFEAEWINVFWEWVGQLVLKRPGLVWLMTMGVMAPFVLVSLFWYHNLSYGLLSELPVNQTSVVGAEAVQKHFPAGTIGPVTLLIKNNDFDFSLDDEPLLDEFVTRLNKVKADYGIVDVRALTQPLGSKYREEKSETHNESVLTRGARRKRILQYYVGDADQGFEPTNSEDSNLETDAFETAEEEEEIEGNVARMEILFNKDPFSRFSIEQLNEFETALLQKGEAGLLPLDLQSNTELNFLGPPASTRDLKTVTSRDQILIHGLVISAVLLVLIILLKRIAISVYLIFTVFFSYLATLGMTFVVFWSLDPAGFSGLDWKVPAFLFTILIAVGEDYNIYLITRVREEQKRHGAVQGIIEALTKTGSIISSCGLIMAGTFSSLMAGSLVGMHQLGFALAFGVLLDTFLVRPILVPAYLVLLHSDRLGILGRFLKADAEEELTATDI